jgi:hypothetical protein
MSKKKNKSVLEPAEPKTIAIEPGAVALTIGGRKGDGMKADAHRYRWLDIDAGGRPPRDATLCSELVAALKSAPPSHGKRGRPTAKACDDYLREMYPKTSRKIRREAVKNYLSP